MLPTRPVFKSKDSMEKLPDYMPSSRHSRRNQITRNGSWRKRYSIVIFLVCAWILSRYTSQAITAKHANLYEELHKMVVDATTTAKLGSRSPTSPVESRSMSAEVVKVSMAYGNISETYQRALDRHMLHSDMHSYETLILECKLLGRLYTKPAYILYLILNELQKPEEDRIKWLYWFDLDIVLMNPNIPLETFLPPDDLNLDDVDALVTNDHNGLNTGAFFIRVNYWSAQIFADIVAMPSLLPDVKLKYSEQSAFEIRLKDKRNIGHAVWIPQHWINGYLGSRDERGELRKWSPEATKKGGLQIHFAGKQTTKERMDLYLDIAERRDPRWEIPIERTGLLEETRAFWEAIEVERHPVVEQAQSDVASDSQEVVLTEAIELAASEAIVSE